MALTVVLVTTAFLGECAGNVFHRNKAPPDEWTFLNQRPMSRRISVPFNHRTANIGIGIDEKSSPMNSNSNARYTTATRTISQKLHSITHLGHHQPSTSQNKQAVLTMDNYDGQERLVYKLAPGPGTIIAGRRRDNPFENHDSKLKNNDLKQINYIKSHKKNKNRRPILYNRDNTYKHEPIKNTIFPLKLSSIFATKFWPFAKVFHIGRVKARGAFISLVLMNYLGIVTVPGFPQHMDPSDVMTTFMNMLTGGGNKFKF